MSGKIISFWEYCKLKFHRIMENIRGEYNPDKAYDENEYVINGVRYVVSNRFSKTENKTMKEKISAFIGSDFAHLTLMPDEDKIELEYVTTARKED